MHIAVLMGGVSSEREISVLSSSEITKAARALGHQVTVIEMTEGVLTQAQEARWFSLVADDIPPFEKHKTELPLDILLAQLGSLDKVFIGLHGGRGENGAIQAELETLGIPFTGSGSESCSLAMNKYKTKKIYESHRLPTPQYQIFKGVDLINISFPFIIKPNQEGSSVGLSLIQDEGSLDSAINYALKYDREVLVEDFIDGQEFTVGVLGEMALTPGIIKPKNSKLFDYQAKYHEGATEEIFPPPGISMDEINTLRQLALKAHKALGLRGYSRTDFLQDQAGHFFILETNTLPGLTRHSLLPKSAQASGISFMELIEKILD
jgi:D-alanine-D-alanine ligase